MDLLTKREEELLYISRKKDEKFRQLSVPLKGELHYTQGRDQDIRFLIYKPSKTKREKADSPVYFEIHGGGFVSGMPDRNENFCQRLADEADVMVINIDYRLAPEYAYPIGVFDVYDTVLFVKNNAGLFGINPSKMAIGGHSAGGNLAAAVSLMAKSTGEFSFTGQVLDYPPLDLYTENDEEKSEMGNFFDKCYLKERSRGKEIYASPLRASREELQGLEPALIITAEKDDLKKDGVRFYENLILAGVECEYHNFIDAAHGFTTAYFEDSRISTRKMSEKELQAASQAFDLIKDYLIKISK